MVAFGPAEVEVLNNAARGLLGLGGPGGAAELPLGRNSYAVGDHVLALRRIGPARSATHGTVVALETRGLRIEWRGAERESLVVLGDPRELASRSAQVKRAWVALSGPGMPAAGPGGTAARRRAGLIELATCWPDEAMLERAGPRPLAPAMRRRWAEVIATCALERDLGLDASIPRPSLVQRSLAVGPSPRL